MLFTKLKLNYFGRFHDRDIDLKPGINLIYGENEAGKSTIHTFIKGMLFGIERLRGRGSASKDDLYTRYLPWNYPGAFSGTMDVMVGDKEYRLQRNFHTNDKNFTILDITTGREVNLKEGLISEMIPGLTESAFKNTISIEQLKAKTDTELAAQVRNYITNLSIAKSKEVNVAKAVRSLTDQKKALEAGQSTTALKTLQLEIEEGTLKEERIDTLTMQLRDLLIEEKELKRQKEEVLESADGEEVKRREQLPAILEKYRTYRELTRQLLQIEKQRTELKEKISTWEVEKQIIEELRQQIKDAEKLDAGIREFENRKAELLEEEETNLQVSNKRNMLLSIVPAGLIALLSLLLARPFIVGIVIALIAVLAGGIAYGVMNRAGKMKHKQYESKINAIAQQLSASKEEFSDILRRNQATTIEELSEKKEELLKHSYALEHSREQIIDLEHRKNEADDNRDMLYDSIMKYIRCYIPVEELSDIAMQRLQEEISRKKQAETQRQSEINQRYEQCNLRIEKLRWELSTMEGNEGQLLKNKEKYAELEQKLKEDTVELEAVKLALSTIQSLSIDIHDSFGRQLNLAVSEIIGEVTGHKYTDIKVNEKLDVKVGWNGDYILLDKLSAGTMDQVYFALRLAVADLLLGKDEVPLLLDDSFALYDENRVKSAMLKIADRKQIIMFSCHKREQRLLEELEIPYHFVDLSR